MIFDTFCNTWFYLRLVVIFETFCDMWFYPWLVPDYTAVTRPQPI